MILRATGVENGAAVPEPEPAEVFSEDEQREVEERLRGLGYLE
jgi:hypothetical protein